MKVLKIFQQKYLWMLIFSFLFALVSCYQYYRHKNVSIRLSSARQNIEEKLVKKESSLTEKVQNLSTVFSTSVKDSVLKTLDLSSQFEENGIAFYLFTDSAMTYWSTNRVPLSLNFDSALYSKPIIQLLNGWYQPVFIKKGKVTVLGLALIKYNFLYENSYLENSFAPDYHIDQDIQLKTSIGEYAVHDAQKRFLFTLFLDEDKTNTDYVTLQIIFLLSVSLALFLFAVHLILIRYLTSRPRLIALFLFLIAVFILVIRFLFFIFKAPVFLYQSKLFSPIYYASSSWLPSLGDLLLHSIVLIFSILLIKKAFTFYKPKQFFNKWLNLFITFGVLFIQFFTYKIFVLLFKSIVFNSSISFNNDSIFNYTYLNYLVFLIIGILLVLFIYISYYFVRIADSITKKNTFWLIFLVSIGLFTFVNYSFLTSYKIIWIYFYGYYIFVAFLMLKQITISKGFIKVILLLLFSVFVSQLFDEFYSIKERDERILIAGKLGTQHDPITEYRLGEVSNLIVADSKVNDFIASLSKSEAKLLDYLDRTYLSTFSSKYKINVTVCSENRVLRIQPENYKIECSAYFDQKIAASGSPTKIENLWFMNYAPGQISYLLTIDLQHISKTNQIKKFKLFIEFDSKTYVNDSGYPELLIDKKRKGLNNDFSRYSYARYVHNDLVNQYGKFSYSTKLNLYKKYKSENLYFVLDGFTHLYYRFNDHETIIIGKRNLTFFEQGASVSFFFILYGVMLLIISLIILNPVNLIRNKLSFQLRMQIYMISIIIVSFILIGMVTIYYFLTLNNKKNVEFVNEKTHSILIQFEEQLNNQQLLTDDVISFINQTAVKLSERYFTDINVYNVEGQLIASSRPQMFQQGLIQDKMNTDALYDFKLNKKTLYFHDEYIGKQKYWSVYMPFLNRSGDVLLYINMPYFAKQKELNNEMSSFVVTFLSIYMFVIFITIIIALLLARYISRPLILIKEQMSQIQLGDKNEKIEWKSTDEIGNLVEVYNKMVEELRMSAELLASSQREQAWREMAQQVAHEIKNPLTPMKLSVQMLERTWHNGDPNWETRLTQFAKTLIEQIDTLADIATSFSSFAKMPEGAYSKEDLLELVESIVPLHNYPSVTIKIVCDKERDYLIEIDKNQMIRVFNNLIRNAVQAIKSNHQGLINIKIQDYDELAWLVSVEDNGIGIADEVRERIFSPNFTTKTSGMGLGLAMVKNIIVDFGGTIWFESEVGKGSTFYFTLPKGKDLKIKK
ncbi:MAG: ATP-binding protein [Bacteroidota bacterium]